MFAPLPLPLAGTRVVRLTFEQNSRAKASCWHTRAGVRQAGVGAWNVGVSLVLDWCSPSKWGQTRRDRLENRVLPENTRVRTRYTRVLPGFFAKTQQNASNPQCWRPKSSVSQTWANTWLRAGVRLSQHLANLSVGNILF